LRAVGISTGNRSMKRFAFAGLWTCVLTFVFLFLCCFVVAVWGVVTLKGDEAQNKAAIDQASRQWALPMFFGSLVAAVAVSAWGVLPGTRRRPAAATGPGGSADSDYPADFDFPAAQPIIAVLVGPLEEEPPELAALGPPLSVHRPGWLASMSGFGRLATFVFGLVLLVAPLAVVNALDADQLPQSARLVLVFGPILACLTCLLIAVWPRSPYTYQVHDDALVVSDRKTMRIIPWDQIQAIIPERPLLKDLTVVTRDGQEVPITNVRGYHQLFNTLFIQVRDHLLPLMIRKANAGRMVQFGPLGVSSDALCYQGQTTPWDEVSQMLIMTGSGMYQLMVYHRSSLGIWPFIRLSLGTLPNDLLLRELLKHIAPSRLLVPADQARW
jgi:Family of unknown function (DUF6585)